MYCVDTYHWLQRHSASSVDFETKVAAATSSRNVISNHWPSKLNHCKSLTIKICKSNKATSELCVPELSRIRPPLLDRVIKVNMAIPITRGSTTMTLAADAHARGQVFIGTINLHNICNMNIGSWRCGNYRPRRGRTQIEIYEIYFAPPPRCLRGVSRRWSGTKRTENEAQNIMVLVLFVRKNNWNHFRFFLWTLVFKLQDFHLQ